MTNTWVVTGANRGIGLEYTKQLLAAGNKVVAGVRNLGPADSLSALAADFPRQLGIRHLDLSSWDSIDAFATGFADQPIDYLINNAGLYGGSWDNASHRQSKDSMDYALWEEIMRVNVMAPFRLTRALQANLQRADEPLVVMMSSDLGSITNNEQGQSYAYRSSKAALNMVTKGLAVEAGESQCRFVAMAPGWTKTDLGGAHADWTVEESVAHQINVILGLDGKTTGAFINLLGEAVPW